MTGNGYAHLEKSQQLQKHIGVHIQTFSLLAFLEPDEANENPEIDTMNVSEHRKSGSNLSSVSLDFDNDLGATHAELDRLTGDETELLDNEVEWDLTISNAPLAPASPAFPSQPNHGPSLSRENWNHLLKTEATVLSPGPPAAGYRSVLYPIYDGKDRLELKGGRFLIRGHNHTYFLEHATTGLDMSASDISISLTFETDCRLRFYVKVIGRSRGCVICEPNSSLTVVIRYCLQTTCQSR
jgi:hypothetical protein